MNKETAATILAILIIITTGLRIAIAFSEQELDYDGYKTLRFVEQIKKEGTPLIKDELSFGGRTRAYNPLYYYLLALFSIMMPAKIAIKFIPNVLFSLTIALVYFIGYDITRNRTASLIAAGVASLTPIIFSEGINNGNPLMLATPLLLLGIYTSLDLAERKKTMVIAGVALALTSPLAVTLVIGLLIFLITAGAEKIQINKEYSELTVFLLLFSAWVLLLTYKKALLSRGLGALWAYLPPQLIKNYFSEFTIPQMVTTIGIIPIIFGGYAAYRALFVERVKKIILLSSYAGGLVLMLIARIVPLRTGMLLLAITMAPLSAEGIRRFIAFFDKTRIPWAKQVAMLLLALFFIMASALPAITSARLETPTDEQITAYKQMSNNSIILTPLVEGYVVEYYGKKTYYDRDFLLIPNSKELYEDAQKIYRSRFATPALILTSKHGIKEILLDKNARKEFGIKGLAYSNHECLRKKYEGEEFILYEVLCDVKKE